MKKLAASGFQNGILPSLGTRSESRASNKSNLSPELNLPQSDSGQPPKKKSKAEDNDDQHSEQELVVDEDGQQKTAFNQANLQHLQQAAMALAKNGNMSSPGMKNFNMKSGFSLKIGSNNQPLDKTFFTPQTRQMVLSKNAKFF